MTKIVNNFKTNKTMAAQIYKGEIFFIGTIADSEFYICVNREITGSIEAVNLKTGFWKQIPEDEVVIRPNEVIIEVR